MAEFFDSRLEIYDDHMRTNIDSAEEFYRFTAEQLPKTPGCRVLDLGCGTGLELEYYFPLNPAAKVTGIDLAPGMLGRLKEKFYGKDVDLILGSYFDVPFGEEVYDAAVSVESLHHFTAEEKTPLYEKLRRALRPGGYFILTDYFALSDEEEAARRSELARLKREQGIADGALYHFDTPLTAAHEIACLRAAGFAAVEVLNSWGATHTIRASR
jgi:tRNA (cmo5U34)-methyltransferase